jgi:hypothetical protein
VSAQHKLGELLPQGWGATVLGPEPGASLHLDRADKERLAETIVRPGAIVVGYPGARPAVVFSFEGDAEQVTQRAVHGLARVIVLLAVAAAALLLGIYLVQLGQRRGRQR